MLFTGHPSRDGPCHPVGTAWLSDERPADVGYFVVYFCEVWRGESCENPNPLVKILYPVLSVRN